MERHRALAAVAQLPARWRDSIDGLDAGLSAASTHPRRCGPSPSTRTTSARWPSACGSSSTPPWPTLAPTSAPRLNPDSKTSPAPSTSRLPSAVRAEIGQLCDRLRTRSSRRTVGVLSDRQRRLCRRTLDRPPCAARRDPSHRRRPTPARRPRARVTFRLRWGRRRRGGGGARHGNRHGTVARPRLVHTARGRGGR